MTKLLLKTAVDQRQREYNQLARIAELEYDLAAREREYRILSDDSEKLQARIAELEQQLAEFANLRQASLITIHELEQQSQRDRERIKELEQALHHYAECENGWEIARSALAKEKQ